MTTPPRPKRKKLGRWAGLATRYAIYETENAIEIDEQDQFEVQRKRVFFDDIVLVTLHKAFGWVGLIFTGLFALLMGITALAIGVTDGTTGLIFGGIALLFAIPFVLRLILRVDVLTIFGRRSKAVLRFNFRKARARALFEHITVRAHAAQRRLAAEIAEMEPPPPEEPASEIPMPPADAVVEPEAPPELGTPPLAAGS